MQAAAMIGECERTEALFADLVADSIPIWSAAGADLPDVLKSAIFAIALLANDEKSGGGYLMLIDHEDPDLIWAAMVELFGRRRDLQDVLRCANASHQFQNKYTGDHIEFVW